MRLSASATVEELNHRFETITLGTTANGRVALVRCEYDRSAREMMAEMAGDPLVSAAELNYRVSNPEAERRRNEIPLTFADPAEGAVAYVDQGALTRIRARVALAEGNGRGIDVAILDTGVDASHPVLLGQVEAGQDFVDDDPNPEDQGDGLDSDGDGQVDEAVGHGTFIAGLVLAVAPEASILPVRILDSDGIGTVFDVVQGLEFATEERAEVVNMSFGMDEPSAILKAAVEAAARGGTILVSSVGNDGLPKPRYPGRSGFVIGVASTDSSDLKADFSNYGDWVDVSAPGVGLVSVLPDGAYGAWSGTSFSAALVSGAGALLASMRRGSDDDRDVTGRIFRGADGIDHKNPDLAGMLGAGRLDVMSAAEDEIESEDIPLP